MNRATSIHPGRALVLVAILAAGIFFWDAPVLLPFKLLAVMGHETGHALASLVVGGSVDRVSLHLDESGACLSRIPQGFFAQTAVYSAGYVGGAVIAVLLLVLTFRFNARRAMLGLACAWLALMGLFYARDSFTLAFCVSMAVAFGLGAKWLPTAAVGALNLFIASFTALYAVMDLKDDLWNGAVRAQSDAQLLANLTVVPALIWAALWTVVSVGILGVGLSFALKEKLPITSPRGAAIAAR
jgi:Peptidase M50B-like